MKKYDAIIIGFGKGGKTLAAGLAERNFTVAMIERSDKMYGGTCINIGCIPTKTLIHSAELADTSASWEQKQAYYRQSVARKEEVTSFLRQKNYRNLSDNPNITVYTGTGSLSVLMWWKYVWRKKRFSFKPSRYLSIRELKPSFRLSGE